MNYSTLLLVVAFTLSTVCGFLPARETATHENLRAPLNTSPYFSAYAKGDKRRYLISSPGIDPFHSEENVRELTPDGSGGGTILLEYVRHDPAGITGGVEILRFGPNGLFLMGSRDSTGVEAWLQGWPLIPNPMPRQGDFNHTTTYLYLNLGAVPEMRVEETYTMRVGSIGTVTTPAEQFENVLRLDVFAVVPESDDEPFTRYSDWYAPSAGLIKSQWHEDDGIHTMELVSLKRAEEPASALGRQSPRQHSDDALPEQIDTTDYFQDYVHDEWRIFLVDSPENGPHFKDFMTARPRFADGASHVVALDAFDYNPFKAGTYKAHHSARANGLVLWRQEEAELITEWGITRMPILPNPLRTGEPHVFEIEIERSGRLISNTPHRYSFRFVGFETLDLTAGQFEQTLRIEYTLQSLASPDEPAVVYTKWLAPGYGLVQREQKTANGVHSMKLIAIQRPPVESRR